jgi:hypothetical protein
MSPSQDDASIRLARRISDALAAGDRGQAVRLTRELERALTNEPQEPASATDAAPSFTAQPAVVPMTQAPAPSRSARPTYIVPALEGRYFQPVRGLLTLSDWPLERRLLGPWSERADHLAATAQLARQLAWLSERDAAVAERLAPVVADMAASIPGAIDGTGLDTKRVAEAAEAERQPLADRDEPWRRDAAARARDQLPREQQLWGTTIGVVAEGEAQRAMRRRRAAEREAARQ